MKKFLVFASLLGATQIIYAAKPEPPLLLTPASTPALLSTAPVLFSWSNSKGVTITGYRLIVSTTPDFSGYNQKTKTCRNNIVCFSTTLKEAKFSLSNLKSMLQPDNNYFWRVESINGQGASTSSVAGFAFGSPKTTIDSKYVIVAMPNIATVTTEFPSVEQGKTLKISATLDVALPTTGSYAVKMNSGNGLVALTGSGVDYSVTITPNKSASYTVGIYDDKNVLKSNKMSGSFEVTAPIPVNVPPVLSLVSKVAAISKIGVNNTYTVILSATDDNGDLRQIDMVWGDGSTDSVNVEDGEKLSLTHIYTTAEPWNWSATAIDYSDAPSNIITQAVTVEAPVIVAPVVITPGVTTPEVVPPAPRFSAMDSTGNTITSSYDWACTRDDKTKLIWEVKTNDSRLHHKDWTYSWYEPDASKNGGNAGVANGGKCTGTSQCNTYAFINAVNSESLCGATNWRLPTKTELEGLVLCSDGKSKTLGANEQGDICTGAPTSPTIDTVYFQNTRSDWVWSSTTLVPPVVISGKAPTAKPKTSTSKVKTTPHVDGTSAWNVIFYHGSSHADNKANAAGVRLVSDVTP